MPQQLKPPRPPGKRPPPDSTPPKEKPGGYADVPFLAFVLAVFTVAAPINFFKKTNQSEWVSRYILLIFVSLIVWYAKPIESFSKFLSNLGS